jgi:hypothetical protein
MKAKVLVSYYRGEGGHTIHRVYLEPHFVQAEADLKMIQDDGSSSKQWELLETGVYAWYDVKVDVIGKAR